MNLFSEPSTSERSPLSASHQSSEPEPESQAVISQEAQQQDTRSGKIGAGIFGSTFLTVFLAEFGDKTQLSTLLMSAESQSPWIVFLGSAAALVTTSLLGVLLGQWLATRLAPKTVKTAAGASMLLISLKLLWDVLCSFS